MFLNEYATKSAEKFRSSGSSVGVVATNETMKMRGLWDPCYTVWHFLPDRESFMRLLHSGLQEDLSVSYFSYLVRKPLYTYIRRITSRHLISCVLTVSKKYAYASTLKHPAS